MLRFFLKKDFIILEGYLFLVLVPEDKSWFGIMVGKQENDLIAAVLRNFVPRLTKRFYKPGCGSFVII
jgi:hypothetical protein